jgi:hypothetical protein
MKVTDGESEAFIEDLGAMLDEFKVPETEQKELLDQAGGECRRHQRRPTPAATLSRR